MSTTCPKCRYVRLPSDRAPDWQCPSCGVAYAKASESSTPATTTARAAVGSTGWVPSSRRAEGGRPGLKLLAAAAVAYGAWVGWQSSGGKLPDFGGAPDVAKLAASVKPGDVTIYTTSTCGYCKQAIAWMGQHGFAFKECNIETDGSCRHDYNRYGGDGVPYLVVKGHHMKQGFNTDQFLAALKP
jgi:glutaredoxin